MEWGMPVYAQVIVDINSRDIDRLFTYSVPSSMTLCIGMRVVVPFGSRKLTGMVVSLSSETDVPPDRIRSVLNRIDDEPAVSKEMMQLAFWMRNAYRTTVAAALRCILPAQIRSGKVRPLTRLSVRLLVSKEEALSKCLKSKKQTELIHRLDGAEYGVFLSDLDIEGASSAAHALEKKGIAEIFIRERRRVPYSCLYNNTEDFRLTESQAHAIEEITSALDGSPGCFLLHGVTGSGKTEVYLRSVQHALSRGKDTIFLVPEIALTPQMVSWFRSRFGDTAAVLHSRLSQGEKYDEWRRIRRGEAHVVIGARSAVFAPVNCLGLIIIDEEHENTYISETHPCYDARRVARERCRIESACLVLGSATPSIDTYTRALKGQYLLMEMQERVAGRSLPDVELVDMRKELINGNRSIFSVSLRTALEETLIQGHQAVLFHNRRGYASFVKCRACGYTVHCPHCDVTMTYHSSDNSLKCHYCGAEMKPPTACPSCGSPYIRKFGVGTQQVEEKLKQAFPEVRTIRLDNDTTQGKDDLVRLLTSFRKGEAQVLIGTQMIAKGHDFPNVTLVGVISADMTLNLPDYRSEERTFQLLTQVEGRSGRGIFPGRVIVQSYEPEHYAIAMAATQNYRAFYEEEIRRRRRRLYPPYTLMMRILLIGTDQSDLRAESELLEMEITEWFNQTKERRSQVIQIHAMEAPLGRIRDEYRYQVFVKIYAKNSDDAVDALVQITKEHEDQGIKIELELNPNSFM